MVDLYKYIYLVIVYCAVLGILYRKSIAASCVWRSPFADHRILSA